MFSSHFKRAGVAIPHTLSTVFLLIGLGFAIYLIYISYQQSHSIFVLGFLGPFGDLFSFAILPLFAITCYFQPYSPLKYDKSYAPSPICLYVIIVVGILTLTFLRIVIGSLISINTGTAGTGSRILYNILYCVAILVGTSGFLVAGINIHKHSELSGDEEYNLISSEGADLPAYQSTETFKETSFTSDIVISHRYKPPKQLDF